MVLFYWLTIEWNFRKRVATTPCRDVTPGSTFHLKICLVILVLQGSRKCRNLFRSRSSQGNIINIMDLLLWFYGNTHCFENYVRNCKGVLSNPLHSWWKNWNMITQITLITKMFHMRNWKEMTILKDIYCMKVCMHVKKKNKLSAWTRYFIPSNLIIKSNFGLTAGCFLKLAFSN